MLMCQGPATLGALPVVLDISLAQPVWRSARRATLVTILTKLAWSIVIFVQSGKCVHELH